MLALDSSEDEAELPQLHELLGRKPSNVEESPRLRLSFVTPRRRRQVVYDSDDEDHREVPDSTDSIPTKAMAFRKYVQTPESEQKHFSNKASGCDDSLNVSEDLGLALTMLTLDSDPTSSTILSSSKYFSCKSTPERDQPSLTERPENAVLVYSPPFGSGKKPKVIKSPKKERKIPRTPFRESSIEFWDERKNSAWIDQHVQSPVKQNTPHKTPKKSAAEQQICKLKKEFSCVRERLATDFLRHLIDQIHPELGDILAGPIDITWSRTLSTTAGRATYSKSKKIAMIELSAKVIDAQSRLESTLAHEFCHLLTWCVSNQYTNPHGKEFKSYGLKVYEKFGIAVSTTHSYEIDYKYKWQCTDSTCGIEYGRHSKSLDPSKVACGVCKSRVIQIKPVPRASGTPNKEGLSRYQAFLKENIERIKSANPGLKYAEHIKLVAAEYAVSKLDPAPPSFTFASLTIQPDNQA